MPGHALRSDEWHALRDLLAESYADEELRDLARAAYDDPSIARALPGAGASVQDLVRALVAALERRCAAPQPRFWDYLRGTRPYRADEIDALRRRFDDEADPRTRATSEPPIVGADGIRLPADVCGACDLLEVLDIARSRGEAGVPACLADVVPGTVNGLPRALSLSWTARSLAFAATPSLDGPHARMPNRFELALPVRDAQWRYHPNGRHFYREGRPPPRVHVGVEAWDEHVRRLTLGGEAGEPRFCLEFPFIKKGLVR